MCHDADKWRIVCEASSISKAQWARQDGGAARAVCRSCDRVHAEGRAVVRLSAKVGKGSRHVAGI